MKTQNVFYLIGVLAVILFIAFFLGNVKMSEGFSTTPDNVKIASDAIQKSSAEQKAQIAVPLSKLMEDDTTSDKSEKINPEKIAILNVSEDKSTDESEEKSEEEKSSKGSKQISFNL